MRTLPLIVALASLQPCCAVFSPKSTAATGQTANPNSIVSVAQNFTDTLFVQEQPAITTAVAHLPAETQALAQAAYAALQKGIDEALEKGVSDLSTQDQIKAQAALVALGNATDTLHAVLHSGGDPHLAPLSPTDPGNVLPGAPAVPTVAVPAP